MAPPGRRRSPGSVLLSLLFLFIAIANFAHAQSAVIGLDIGTEYIKAALVKPGVPLDIVLTKDSKRKEAAVIGFKPVSGATSDAASLPERLYGSDALAVAPRFPGDTYPNLKPLLGSLVDSRVSAASYKQRFPALEQAINGDALAFKSGFDKDMVSVEELLAMEMASMKANAQVMAGPGLAIKNAVITIPAYYTVDEKRAVQLAAELAGLNVMALITDGMAVALNYATSRNLPNIDKGEKAEHHLVYDMGAGSTTASVLRFQSRTVKDVGKFNKTIQELNVLGIGWDKTLGGDTLNEMIVDDMVDKFVASSAAKSAGVTAEAVKKHGRTMAKLWREAERLRQVLSANSATSATFESLYDDVDFKYKLSRADFEIMAETYKSRISAPLEDALADAKLTVDDLDSVVLHGGMVRTPFVQKELESRVKDAAKLRSNVNADEAAVFGAAFKAAGLSPSFKVRDIKTNDIAIYGATLKWTSKGKSRSQNIFIPASQAGVVKQMPFNLTEDFSLSIAQQVPSTAAGEFEDRQITEVKVANLTASIAELLSKHGCSKDDINTVLSIRLDPVLGVPEVFAASSSCESAAKSGSVIDGVKGLFGLGDKKDQEPLSDDSPEESTETIAGSASASGSEAASSSAASKQSEKPKKKIETINLALETTRADLRQASTDQLSQMRDRLAAFDASDKTRRLRDEAFNTLEAYLYRARDVVEDESFVEASTAAQRAEIEKLVASTSEWIHGEGTTATTDVIKEQHAALKDLISPVQKRKDENAKRPKAIENMQKSMSQVQAVLTRIRERIDKDAEAASSFASSVAAQASSTVSSVSDDLGDLEDATAASESAATTPTLAPPLFSETDYDSLSAAYETARDWLKERVEEQSALSPSDEPAFSFRDVSAASKKLNEALSSLLTQETIRQNASSSSSSSKTKAKSKKTKSAKSASDTKSSSSSPTTVVASESPSASEAPPTEEEGHTEL